MDVFVELKAIISDFQAKMAAARGEMEKTSKAGASNFQSLGKLSSAGFAGVAVAVGAVGALAVDMGMKFQDSTARMAAAGDIPIKTAQQIGNAFLTMGGNTVYSGTQVEQAYGAVAGQLSTLKGYTDNAASATAFMGVAMDLTEESGGTLSSTTADLAKIMQTYGIGVKGAAGVSVDLFNASRLTGQSVDTLTQAMTRLHSQMGAATPPIGQASALLVDLTEHGETGRQAMSALSSMFTGIISPTKAVTAAQQAMGVTFVTAHGQLLPMSQIIAELGPKIAGMGSAQAAATLKSLGFGSASLKLVQTIQAGPAAFDAASRAVNNATAAHAALAAQQNTLAHQVDALKVTFENLITRLGVALIPILQKVMGVVIQMVAWFMKHRQVTMDLAIALGVLAVALGVAAAAAFIAENVMTFGLAAAIAALVVAVLYLATHWQQSWADMQKWAKQYSLEIAAALLVLSGGMLLIPAVALVVYAHWQILWNGMKTTASTVAVFIINDVLKPIVDGFLNMARAVITAAADAFGWVPGVGGKLKAARSAIDSFIAQTNSDMNGWANTAKQLGDTAGSNLGNGLQAGIKASLPAALAASAYMVATVVHQMHQSAGNPNSPAPATIPIGEALALGIAQGISNKQAAAIKASQALMVGTTSIPLPAGIAAPGGSNAQLGQQMAAQLYGWTGAQWAALNQVAMDESGWSTTAQNPTSGAYGIAQFINGPAEYAQYGGSSSTAQGQIMAFLNYIAQRYGTPLGALAHENAFHWYDKGGLLPPGLSLALNTTGRAEVVRPGPAGAGDGGPVTIVLQVDSKNLGQVVLSSLLELQRSRHLGLKAS